MLLHVITSLFSYISTFLNSPFPLLHTASTWFHWFLYFIFILTDMQSWQVVYESSVRKTGPMSVSEGHAPVGSPNSLHIQTLHVSFLPSPHLPFCPCRPGTCVTYNWFINNASRCSWSSLESCQLASILFYCHSLTDSLPLNARWHRIEESDVFLILIRMEVKKSLHRLYLLHNLCMSMSGRSVTHQQKNALSWHSWKLSILLWICKHIARQAVDPDQFLYSSIQYQITD